MKSFSSFIEKEIKKNQILSFIPSSNRRTTKPSPLSKTSLTCFDEWCLRDEIARGKTFNGKLLDELQKCLSEETIFFFNKKERKTSAQVKINHEKRNIFSLQQIDVKVFFFSLRVVCSIEGWRGRSEMRTKTFSTRIMFPRNIWRNFSCYRSLLKY